MSQIAFISLVTLIQSPEKFDNKAVRVVGLCTFEFEGKAIWISSEALENAITKNAVWLDIPLTDELRAQSRKIMLVEGVFSAERKGHLGLYSGTIEKVSRLASWPPASD
jgi:hypothetical protein